MSLTEELDTALIAGLEIAVNHYLHLDPEAAPRLASLETKVIALELHGLDITLYLLPGTQGLDILRHYQGTPDTVIAGTPLALAGMGHKQNKSESLFSGEVEINGDIETGQRFQRILEQLDIDWEEWLAQYTGDIAAHKLGYLTRKLRTWSQEALQTLGKDLGEYLQQESRDVATGEELDAFVQDIDTLRHDVDRLEARIRRLQTPSNP